MSVGTRRKQFPLQNVHTTMSFIVI